MDTTVQSHEHKATLPSKGKTQTWLGIMVNCPNTEKFSLEQAQVVISFLSHSSQRYEREREKEMFLANSIKIRATTCKVFFAVQTTHHSALPKLQRHIKLEHHIAGTLLNPFS